MKEAPDDAGEGRRSPIYPWYVLGVLFVAYTFSFVDRTILSLLIPSIRADLNISDTQVSLLAGFAFAVFYTIAGLPLGVCADRWSRKWMIAGGATLWSLMTAVCAAATGFWPLFWARVGVGVGEATPSPAAYSLITDYFNRRRLGLAMAIYHTATTLGGGLALMAGGLLVHHLNGLPPVRLPGDIDLEAWRLTFLWVGLPGLCIPLLMLTVREPARRPGAVNPSLLGGLDDFRAFLVSRRAAFGGLIVGLAPVSLVIYGFMSWLPTFFARSHGMSPGEAGAIYGAILAVAGTAGLLSGGWFADRLVARGVADAHARTILFAVAASIPFYIAAPLVDEAWLAFALLAPATFFAQAFPGLAAAALQIVTPPQFRAQVTAVYFLCVSFSALALGPTLVAVLTDYGFGDDSALRYSLSSVAAVGLPLSCAVLFLALPAIRRGLVASNPSRLAS